MPLFDDPVEATIGGDPVLWLGCENDGSELLAIVVGPAGHVSAVTVTSVRANFRRVNGAWANVDDAGAAEMLKRDVAEGLIAQPLPAPTGTEPKLPPGTIYDSAGNPYTADGDPLT